MPSLQMATGPQAHPRSGERSHVPTQALAKKRGYRRQTVEPRRRRRFRWPLGHKLHPRSGERSHVLYANQDSLNL